MKNLEKELENSKNNKNLFRNIFIQQIKNFQQKYTNIEHLIKLIEDDSNFVQQGYCTGNNVQEIDIQQVKQDQQQMEKIKEIQRMDQDYQLQNFIDQELSIQQVRVDQQQFVYKSKQQIIEDLNIQHQNSKGLKGKVKNIKKEVKISQQQIIQEFQYQLIEDKRIKLEETCNAFEFNNENSILFVACGKVIIVYKFNNDKIKQELQRLDEHTDCVVCLYFMQKSKNLVSGSHDNTIIIWEADQYNQWLSIKILKDYKQQINCLQINKSENIIFSGNYNNQIKIWKKENDFWICKQTIRLKDSVYAISLNEMENKLISCVEQSKINVIEIKNDKNWSLVQEIKTSSNGFRLCFMQENQFAFQPCYKNYLEIYNYDIGKRQFQRQTLIYIIKQNNCYKYFPCQFIKSLNMLIVKNGKHLNIFKINQYGNHELIQTIDFCYYDFFGKITNDGEFLVTWEQEIFEIEFWKLIKPE